MDFHSALSASSKQYRAILLVFALAEMLTAGGERVGLLGAMAPTAHRAITQQMAERLVQEFNTPKLLSERVAGTRLGRFGKCVLVSDFLDPIETIVPPLTTLAERGLSGELIQVLDPVEESLAYEGQVEFADPESGRRWHVPQVESVRDRYFARMAEQRAALNEFTHRYGWRLLVHHTDQPASAALLSVMAQLTGHNDKFMGPNQSANWGAS
jgi:uncharacterized protein (DUF58 family)